MSNTETDTHRAVCPHCGNGGSLVSDGDYFTCTNEDCRVELFEPRPEVRTDGGAEDDSGTSQPRLGISVTDLIRPAYNGFVRPRLPRKWAVYGDIPSRDAGLLDFKDHISPYKPGLKRAIRENIHGGTVVLVGGGRGVSSCWIARQGADVVALEAATEMVPIARQTVEMQGHSNAVEVRHALVGEAIDVFGDAQDAERIDPADLDTGDALIMDCEGAERSILRSLADWPPTIIVETHPDCGVPTDVPRRLLDDVGYRVTEMEYSPKDPRKRVLVGDRDE